MCVYGAGRAAGAGAEEAAAGRVAAHRGEPQGHREQTAAARQRSVFYDDVYDDVCACFTDTVMV